MTFSLKRVNAILLKDWKDLLKNSYIIFTLAFPLIFAVIIGKYDDGGLFITFPINFALVISGCFVQAAMVAEEKEKNTLRGLLLSPASTLEVLIGKSALSAIVTIIVIVASVFLSGFETPSIFLFSLNVLLCLIIYITVGTLLGLFSRTVMETTIIGMPVLMIFGVGSLIKSAVNNEILLKIISFLPNEQFDEIISQLSKNGGLSDVINNFLILVVWVLVMLAITFYTYGKRRFDK
ncbi:ABC transporter permease [Priestia megaterium]|jgi:ABC-2 type transport system permease protein|uniref:ABC transporter permease n=1 Tax=Priestia megaterium TaxID=1404 RepID=UPI00285B64CE|nr:ABC transporter permease [Priestia megaterium]MDR7246989.1 ABC-2 type transport system permease protein [Priestia megaterium]